MQHGGNVAAILQPCFTLFLAAPFGGTAELAPALKASLNRTGL